MSISIKSKQEIEKMRQSGRIAAVILQEVAKELKPGITTKKLNDTAEELCKQHGVTPAFKGYDGFPAVLCTSVNDIIVHGVPNSTPLKNGDIVGLDFGVIYQGWYSDTAVTLPVGEASHELRRLIKITKKSLRLGIRNAKPGNTTGDIGNAIQRFVESEGYSVVKELVGHGIGRNLHEDPQVPNLGKRGRGDVLKAGMVIAIEPMVVAGKPDLELHEDQFGYKSGAGFMTAHFEHTVAIGEKGPQILTLPE